LRLWQLVEKSVLGEVAVHFPSLVDSNRLVDCLIKVKLSRLSVTAFTKLTLFCKALMTSLLAASLPTVLSRSPLVRCAATPACWDWNLSFRRAFASSSASRLARTLLKNFSIAE
jgi:hypothetical protein